MSRYHRFFKPESRTKKKKTKQKVVVLQTIWGVVGQDVLVLRWQVFGSLHNHLKQNLIC